MRVLSGIRRRRALTGLAAGLVTFVVASGPVGPAVAESGSPGAAAGARPHAASSQSDSSFGQSGVATIAYLDGGEASALAIQSDGGILVGGAADSSSSEEGQVAVSRLLPTGVADTSFGTNGVATVPLNGEVESVAVTSAGDILALCDVAVLGTSGSGSSGSGSGSSGSGSSGSGSGSSGSGSSGSQLSDIQTYLVALTSTGTLDTSFGSGGEVELGSPNQVTTAGGLAVLSSGNIVAGVTEEPSLQSSTAPTGAVYQLTSAGAADSTWGTSGAVPVSFGVVATAAGPSGGVLAGGASLDSAGLPVATVEELTSAGVAASSFGTSGVATADPTAAAGAVVDGIAVDTQGRIDLAVQPVSQDNDIARLTSAGSLDTSFGVGGFVSLSDPLLDFETSDAIAATSTGGVVVSGVNDLGIITARFLTSGQPDVGFGTDGIATAAWPEGGPPLEPGGLAIQSDGDPLASATGPGGSSDALTEAGYVADFQATDTGATTQANQVSRVAGTNRVDTAVKASQALFATAPTGGSGSLAGVNSSGQPYAGGVVLASSLNYPDALVGVPLAAALKGPLLLTSGTSLESEVSTEIDRVLGGGSSGGVVDVLGGTAVISDTVVGQLTSEGYTVHRYAGSDRYGTSTAVAGALDDPSVVLEATGTDFADAASAGAAAAHEGGAVLLTNGSTQSSEVQQYLTAHPDDVRYAIGAPAAAADPGATAIVGADRYATSAAVASRFFTTPAYAGVATGLDFPDALVGGVVAALDGGPLLLTDTDSLPAPVVSWLQSLAPWIANAAVIGGTAAVSNAVQTQLAQDIT